MNDIRERLLQLTRRRDISDMSLREIARELGVKNPQTIKFHLQKLHGAGLLDYEQRPTVQIQKDMLKTSDLIRIPILGTVSAGPATQIVSNETKGYLRVSSKLLSSKNYKDLYALQVVGSSMNRANINGKTVDDGDYAIIDSSKRSPHTGEYVIAQVDNLANLKKFHLDNKNKQVVLISESSEDYLPIFVHPEDSSEGLISGTVVQVLKQPVQ